MSHIDSLNKSVSGRLASKHAVPRSSLLPTTFQPPRCLAKWFCDVCMEGARRCSNDHLQHTLKAALQLPSSLCCKSTNQKVATPHSNASLPGSIWSYCMYLTIDSNHFHFKRLKSAWTASRPACTYLKTPVLTRHAGKESRVWQQNMKPSKWATLDL